MSKSDIEMRKIAYYYYKCQYTQQEIGKKLGFSRQKINRLLKKALADGIVEITIKNQLNSHLDIENKFETLFNLDQVIVVDNFYDDTNIQTTISDYLALIIKDNDTIGVTWGKTLSNVFSNIKIPNKKNISILQIIGGLNSNELNFSPSEITVMFANALNAMPYSLFAPAIVSNEESKNILEQEETCSFVMDKYSEIDISIVGIGDFSDESTLIKNHFLTKEQKSILLEKNCIGDVSFLFFDVNGNSLEPDFTKNIIGIKLNTYKNIKRRIGVAYGKSKINAIIGAIKGKYINSLITDLDTAKLILNS